jgi:hypothetical protein
MDFNRRGAREAEIAKIALAAFLCSVLPTFAMAAEQTNNSPTTVTLPVKLRQGGLMAEATINGSEPLAFKLDTGFGITVIHPDLVEKLNLRQSGHLTISGIAGDEQADMFAGAVFDFHGMTFSPRRIAALPSEARRRRRTRDGIIGADFFRRFVVEIDFVERSMRLHKPDTFTHSGQGEVLPLRFKRDTPIVEATIVPIGGEPITGPFEIDSGCDDCVCLGHEFVTTNRLLENTNSGANDLRHGVGGSAEIHSGKLQEVRVGKELVKEPSTNFFLEGSPAGEGQAGHIGLGVLQRFRVIFDYSRRQMILEKVKRE